MKDLETVLCRLHSHSRPRYPRFTLCRECRSETPHEAIVVGAVVNYFSKLEFREFFIETEHEIRIGVHTPRPDVVLLDNEGNRVLIVECKREGIIDQGIINYGIDQLKSYLTASDVQFGIFADSTEPDEWVFFENLRRYNFKENISRVQVETEIIAGQPIESIREEKDRFVRETEQTKIQLGEEVCLLSTQKDHLQSEIATKNQQLLDLEQRCQCLLVENNLLEREKDRLEKNVNHIKRKTPREVLKKEKEDWPRLDELNVTFALESISGQMSRELERLDELESEIARKQQIAQENQNKHAAYEQNKVEINRKRQQLDQVSRERYTIRKQLRIVVNRLKTTNPEQKVQIERHREQLVKDLRKRRPICSQFTTEINQLKETESKLETEIGIREQQFLGEGEGMFPVYLQIQKEIDRLTAEKSKLKAEIGHRIYMLLKKKD